MSTGVDRLLATLAFVGAVVLGGCRPPSSHMAHSMQIRLDILNRALSRGDRYLANATVSAEVQAARLAFQSTQNQLCRCRLVTSRWEHGDGREVRFELAELQSRLHELRNRLGVLVMPPLPGLDEAVP